MSESRNEELLQDIIDESSTEMKPQSRVETILKAIIDGTDSSELPKAQSRNEALLLEVLDKINEGGSDVDVEPLTVDANGTYTAPSGTAYNPVTVNVPTGDILPPAPTDGNIHLYVYIPQDTNGELLKMAVYLNNNGSAIGRIRWGDNSGYESLQAGGYTYGHIYRYSGIYDVSISITSGTIMLDGTAGGSGLSVYGNRASANHYRRGRIMRIYLNDKVTSIGTYALYNCYNLEHISLADVTTIDANAIANVYALNSIEIPATVTNIGASAFNNCYNIIEYHFKSTTPPILNNENAFTGIRNDCVIYVPHSADHSIFNAYKTATNWSAYASYMQEEPQ